MKTELFAADYTVAVLDELPNGRADYTIAAEPSAGHKILIVVRNTRGGNGWTASISGHRDTTRGSISGCYPTPDPHVLCAIHHGTAFLVDTFEPEDFARIATDGRVTSVHSVIARKVLLLGSTWAVTAIGDSGILWQTPRFSIENLRIDEIEGSRARGVVDYDSDEPCNFAVDLASGTVVGGATI